MRMARTLLAALAASMALAAPAMAEVLSTDVGAERVDAYTTQVPALTWTLAEDRRAAVVFLDDAITLLTLADERLQGDRPAGAAPELMAASGKLTSAYLLLFRDRRGAEALRDAATRIGGGAPLATMDVEEARDLVADVRGQVAAAYNTQLAALGGGAGGGFVEGGAFLEELEHAPAPAEIPAPAGPEPETPELPVPLQDRPAQ